MIRILIDSMLHKELVQERERLRVIDLWSMQCLSSLGWTAFPVESLIK